MNRNPSPESTAWLWSNISYRWVNPLFKISRRRALEQEDLFHLPSKESTRVNTLKFQQTWDRKLAATPEEKKSNKKLEKHFKWSLWSIVRKPMIIAGFFRLFNSLIQLAVPFAVAEFLEYIDDEARAGPEESYGFVWAIVLGILFSLKAIVENRLVWLLLRGGWQARSVVSSAVFNKSLRLSASSRQALSQGQIVNLMQLDAEKLEKFAPNFHVFWDSVFQIAGYCAVVYVYIEEAVFVGLGVLLLTIPIQAFLYVKLGGYLRKLAAQTDERVNLTNEALISILAIKSAGWEENFAERIREVRKQELKPLRDSLIIRSVTMAFIISVPTYTAVAGLTYFGLTRGDNAVSAAILFASIQGFNSLRFPLFQIPNALTTYTDAKVSQKRLARFLALPESGVEDLKVKVLKQDDKSTNGEVPIVEVKDGEFFWNTGQTDGNVLGDKPKKAQEEEVVTEAQIKAALTGINLVIPKGALVGVVGTVGSGKSTLLNALLGELEQTRGTMEVNSTAAFAAQTAWIQNATLRDNILFGEEMNRERYQTVLDVCQLRSDLEILQDGDSTIIGERGINLSGGQAQRVSVARAAYSTSELLLLDDPLSALDPEVAALMFDDCILEFLGDRTRVMVTNQLNFLQNCDYVVVLGPEPSEEVENEAEETGELSRTNVILMQGTFEELMDSNKDFNELLSSFQGDDDKAVPDESPLSVNYTETVAEDKVLSKVLETAEAHELMQVEERESGAVKAVYYWHYVKASGACIFFFGILALFFGQTTTLLNAFLLSFWADDPEYEDNELSFYLIVYAVSAAAGSIMYFFQNYIFYYAGLRASRKFHSALLDGIFRAPMSFFDTTPTGRIVSRFSRDLFSLDTELPQNLIFFLFFFGLAFSAIVGIGTQLPVFLVLIPFICIFFYFLMQKYRPLARDVKRLESISRSPIYAHFGETLTGLSSIRAYGKAEEFKTTCENNIDESLRATYIFKAIERWIGVRLELASALIITITVSLITYVEIFNNESITAGTAGVILNLVLTFTGIISGIVRSFVTVEAIFNSVERLEYYAKNIDQEQPFTSDNPPDESWPQKGAIVFNDVHMKYRVDTPMVLKGVTVTIPGGSSCGVVGRTGCGKSSLMLTLLRVVETHSGSITIDGLDISTIGLHELRQKISMVPQSPVMFSGTVRSNLDPFGRYNDDALWEVLKQVSLEKQVHAMPGQLGAEVVEYGENFSQGQRQLICMARSLLASAKVLLLDEATSSVDYETDAVIQATIREQFIDCTILTIAHRVQTIADYDNVLVMVEGTVGEFDSPANLLANDTSEFSKIVAEMGTTMAAKVKESVANH